jgi:hypothetical protein
MVNRSLESAQRKVEARNFDIRKQLLEYDDVANDQRKVIYQQRNELLETDDICRNHRRLRTGVPCHRHGPRSTCRPRASRSSGTCRRWKGAGSTNGSSR